MKEQTVTVRQEMNEEWRTELEQTVLAVCNRREWYVGKNVATVDLLVKKFLKMFFLSQKSDYIQKYLLNLWQVDFASEFCFWPARLSQKEHSVLLSWNPLSLENLLFLSIFPILITVSDFLHVFLPFNLYWLPAFSFVHVAAI